MRIRLLGKIICVLATLGVLVPAGPFGLGPVKPASAAERSSGQDVPQLLERAQGLYMQDKLEEALKVADEASAQIWSWAPFHIQKIMFTEEKTNGYGLYQKRAKGGRFKSGQSMYFYVEPKAYGFRNLGQNVFEFGMVLDMYLTSPEGKVLWGKENFKTFKMRSHARNREFFLNITLTLSRVPAGKYGVKLVFRDLVKKQTVEKRMNIEVY